MRLDKLNEFIPEWERTLLRAIQERASLEALILKIEAHDLGKKHDGLCGIVGPPESVENEPCGRFYKHTGLHSWEGGGIG